MIKIPPYYLEITRWCQLPSSLCQPELSTDEKNQKDKANKQAGAQEAQIAAQLEATGVPPAEAQQQAQAQVQPKLNKQLQQIDLRWHDLRHEGACRLLADGVDIRIIQLMLGHASIQQTQRYLNVTDEELRRGLEVSWNNKGRPLRLASGA